MGIGIIAASASATSASSPTSTRSGARFAINGACLGRVFMRLRRKLGLIELGRMRLRRGDRRPFGRLICCARFRGIPRRWIVVCHLRRACWSGFRVLFGRGGFERGGEKLIVRNQWGDEKRPGQKTERAGSLIRALRPGFEDLQLLFEQFAFVYFIFAFLYFLHDRRPSSHFN